MARCGYLATLISLSIGAENSDLRNKKTHTLNQKIKNWGLKFIYSEKATKIFEIFTLLLSYLVPVKSKVKISQNCVAFSEYINFNSTNEQQQSGKKRLCKSGFEILGRRWSYWTIIVKFLRITVIEKLSYFSGKFLLEFGRSVNPI